MLSCCQEATRQIDALLDKRAQHGRCQAGKDNKGEDERERTGLRGKEVEGPDKVEGRLRVEGSATSTRQLVI